MSIGWINLIRIRVIDACRAKNVCGPVCWIGIPGTPLNKDEWES